MLPNIYKNISYRLTHSLDNKHIMSIRRLLFAHTPQKLDLLRVLFTR